MATGRVIRFDEVKGYGFITPSNGGEDVFVHANELTDRGLRVSTGTLVEFRMIESDRGPKAYDVHIIEPGQPSAHDAAVNLAHASAPGDEELLEVFPEAEFIHQVTELLLATAPQLPGATILDLRSSLVQFARKNGWVD
jgi:CspA family cold shock protein